MGKDKEIIAEKILEIFHFEEKRKLEKLNEKIAERDRRIQILKVQVNDTHSYKQYKEQIKELRQQLNEFEKKVEFLKDKLRETFLKLYYANQNKTKTGSILKKTDYKVQDNIITNQAGGEEDSISVTNFLKEKKEEETDCEKKEEETDCEKKE